MATLAASYFTCFSQGFCHVARAIRNALLMQILCLEEFSNQPLLTEELKTLLS